MAGEEGGLSDYQVLRSTAPQETPSPGWARLGEALGGKANGEAAYENGMRIGAQTADALAQARQRITENQGREQAASAIESGQTAEMLGISQPIASLMAARIRAGQDPRTVTEIGLDAQKTNLINKASDPTLDNKTRLGAAFGLHPEGMIPKAEGANGSFISPLNFDPNQAPGAANSPVTVGAEQQRLNTGLINQRDASANASNATAQGKTLANNTVGAGMPKLPPGYQYQLKPDNSGYVMDADGQPTIVQMKATAADGTQTPLQTLNKGDAPGGATEPATSRRFHEAMVNAGGQLSAETENLKALGYTTSRGFMNLGTQNHGNGFMGTTGNALGAALSSTDSQHYDATMTNVGRFITTMENSGRIAPGQASNELKNSLTNTTNTVGDRLYKAALTRQAMDEIESGFEANSAAPELKAKMKASADRVRAAIPFTPNDVLAFERSGNKDMPFEKFLATRQAQGSAAAPAASGAPPAGLKIVN